ncbi:MAG: GTP cyclohydrolase I, partial [Candidatus Brocadiales bacterium]|nr:GTP cyclohydrolase I [Candidatus Bathyanammoxibius sp.]
SDPLTPEESELKAGFQHQEALDAVRTILVYIGENPTREGLRDTPRRFLAMLKEISQPTLVHMTTFASEDYDQMIIQRGIPFWSLCEHHMMPFFGIATVAYLPGESKKVIGLSKLARIVKSAAVGLEIQERITRRVADFLQDGLDPKGVAVILEARHSCMEARGIKAHETTTITSAMTGVFLEEGSARSEFLDLHRSR